MCFFILKKIYLNMRMYLKNKKNKKTIKKKYIFYIILFLILIILIILIKNFNYYYLNYGEEQSKKIVTQIITEAVDNNILKKIESNNLYNITKNKDEEIEMIDYNSYLINIILKDLNNNVTKNLSKIESDKDASFYIPAGSISQNPIFNDKGPKIPVKIKLIGSVITKLNTKILDYGINNSLIKLDINIEAKIKIILPVSNKDILITNTIPVSYKLIKGKIPSYYSDNLSGSDMYMFPVE